MSLFDPSEAFRGNCPGVLVEAIDIFQEVLVVFEEGILVFRVLEGFNSAFGRFQGPYRELLRVGSS